MPPGPEKKRESNRGIDPSTSRSTTRSRIRGSRTVLVRNGEVVRSSNGAATFRSRSTIERANSADSWAPLAKGSRARRCESGMRFKAPSSYEEDQPTSDSSFVKVSLGSSSNSASQMMEGGPSGPFIDANAVNDVGPCTVLRRNTATRSSTPKTISHVIPNSAGAG